MRGSFKNLKLVLLFGILAFELFLPLFFSIPDIQLEYSLQGLRDGLGRDEILTLLFALRNGLAGALVATGSLLLLSLFLSSVFALVRNPYLQAFWKNTLDFFQAFPSVLVALALTALFPRAYLRVEFFLVLGSLAGYTRLMYFRALEILSSPAWDAAVAMGGSDLWLQRRHLWPELLHWVRFRLPVVFVEMLLGSTTLSYIGITSTRSEFDLGKIAVHAKDYLLEAPHLSVGLILVAWLGLFLAKQVTDLLRPPSRVFTLFEE